MKRSIRVLPLLTVVFGLAFAGVAFSSPSFSPAEFGTGESSVASKFVIPSDLGDEPLVTEVQCQAIINPDGSAAHAHCIAYHGDEPLRDAILEAINAATFNPATIDGDAVTMLMNMMVVLQCGDEEECGVHWRLNHGRQDEQFSSDYSAPQPIIDSVQWYEKYPDKLAWIESGQSYWDVGEAKFTVSAQVDERGQPSDARVDFAGSWGYYHYWARKTSKSLMNVRFIPGRFQNEPTPMRLYEYWINPKQRLPART